MQTAWAGEEGINCTVIPAGSEVILEVRDGCESGAPALLSLAVCGRAAYPSGLGNEESAHAAELLPPSSAPALLAFFFPLC